MPAASYDFTDRFGRFFERYGLPRMSGRVLGHLLTCVPPEQTFDDIVEAIGASRSSVSVATQLLVRLELVGRFSVPQERRDRYRVQEGAWTTMLQQDLASARELKGLAESGLELMAGAPRGAANRLRALREFTVFLSESLAPVLAEWERRSSGRGLRRST